MSLRNFALALIGFTATSSQILLLREFISTFHGNELVIGIYLSVWLLATAMGSGPVAKLILRRKPDAQVSSDRNNADSVLHFAIVEFLVGISLLFAAVGVLSPPAALRPAPGEVTGLVAALASSGLFLFPFCLLQGLLFPLGTRLVRTERPDASVSHVYIIEAAGAAAGGLLFSLVLIHLLSSFQNVAIICAVNLLMAGVLFESVGRRGLRYLCFLVVTATVVFCVLDPVTLWVASRRWGAFDVVAVRQSRYGNLAVLSLDSQFSVYQDGLLVFTTEDVRSAEEAAHIPMLEHPSPADVLLIGGGVGGVVREILKHGELRRLDYVELDPELIALSRDVLPSGYTSALDDGRLNVHLTDGRRFLRRTTRHYDVVAMQIPPPYTAQLNRFYTNEFFTLIKDRLKPGGIFAFSAPGVADYIGDDLAAFLGSLCITSESVFGPTIVLPASKSFFVASRDKTPYVVASPESLLSRLAVRDIETLFVRDYFLLSTLSPERLSYMQERIAAKKTGPVNADLKPISFYYDLILWSAEYERFMKKPLQWVFGNSWSLWVAVLCVAGTFMAWGAALRRARRGRSRLVLSVLAVSGFAEMVLELEIILCFQLLYGSLYDRIGILLTSYMVGLAVGTVLERRSEPSSHRLFLRPALIQIGTAAFALCFFGIVYAFVRVQMDSLVRALEWAFPLFAVVAGALGGALFSSASRAFFSSHLSEATRAKPGVSPTESSSPSAGLTYAWDLVGSWAGAAVCSVILFPVMGVGPATAVVVILLAGSGVSLLMSGSGRAKA